MAGAVVTSRLALILASLLLTVACGQTSPATSPATSPPQPTAAAAPAAPTAGSVGSAPTAGVAAPAASAPTTVQIAALRGASDAGLFVAMDRGYFAEQGIDAQFAEVQLGSDIAALLGADQIQVGGAIVTAGLLNAAARGIDIKIVADKGSVSKGLGWDGLILRKDLVDSGTYKGLADLRGKKIVTPDVVSGAAIFLDATLDRAGLTRADVEFESLSFPDQLPAFGSKVIDGAITIEPFITIAADSNLAVPVVTIDEILEDYQVGVLMYAPRFARTESARRFMVAYLRGVRDYVDGIVRKRAVDPVAGIIAKYSTTKDVELIKRMAPVGLNPDGYVNRQSIQGDLEWYVRGGHVSQRPDLNQLVDNSHVDFALQQLGRSGS
jgi:NitT/TauT family transport system substrate-binding protein